jgi:hypothetical protein
MNLLNSCVGPGGEANFLGLGINDNEKLGFETGRK